MKMNGPGNLMQFSNKFFPVQLSLSTCSPISRERLQFKLFLTKDRMGGIVHAWYSPPMIPYASFL